MGGAGNVLLFHQGMDADSDGVNGSAVNARKLQGPLLHVFQRIRMEAYNMLWGKRTEISGSL